MVSNLPLLSAGYLLQAAAPQRRPLAGANDLDELNWAMARRELDFCLLRGSAWHILVCARLVAESGTKVTRQKLSRVRQDRPGFGRHADSSLYLSCIRVLSRRVLSRRRRPFGWNVGRERRNSAGTD